MLIYSCLGFSFIDSLFPKLLNSKSFTPTPFNEVDSYVCNTFLFFDHSLHSLLRFPSSLMRSKFPHNKVYSLFYKVLWVFDNCVMLGSHHFCTIQSSFTTLKKSLVFHLFNPPSPLMKPWQLMIFRLSFSKHTFWDEEAC